LDPNEGEAELSHLTSGLGGSKTDGRPVTREVELAAPLPLLSRGDLPMSILGAAAIGCDSAMGEYPLLVCATTPGSDGTDMDPGTFTAMDSGTDAGLPVTGLESGRVASPVARPVGRPPGSAEGAAVSPVASPEGSPEEMAVGLAAAGATEEGMPWMAALCAGAGAVARGPMFMGREPMSPPSPDTGARSEVMGTDVMLWDWEPRAASDVKGASKKEERGRGNEDGTVASTAAGAGADVAASSSLSPNREPAKQTNHWSRLPHLAPNHNCALVASNRCLQRLHFTFI